MTFFQDLPHALRPREKLLAHGPGALADAELLALLLRTGIAGKNVLQLAQELLDRFGGLSGLLHARLDEVAAIKGLGGPAKRAELAAVLELSRRVLSEQLKARSAVDSPAAVRDYLRLHIGQRPHEVFCVLFLDAQNRLIALEELFPAPSPRPASTRARSSRARCSCMPPRWCWPTTTPAAAPNPRAPTRP